MCLNGDKIPHCSVFWGIGCSGCIWTQPKSFGGPMVSSKSSQWQRGQLEKNKDFPFFIVSGSKCQRVEHDLFNWEVNRVPQVPTNSWKASVQTFLPVMFDTKSIIASSLPLCCSINADKRAQHAGGWGCKRNQQLKGKYHFIWPVTATSRRALCLPRRWVKVAQALLLLWYGP